MQFHRIFVGPLCNNNCIFCSHGKNKRNGNKSSWEIKKELKELSKSNENISFYGGEVTIRKDFFDLLQYAKELGFKKIGVETNGRIFASKEFCKKTIDAGVTDFLVSLQGFCKEQHDYLTKTPGSFSQTINGIKNLNETGQNIMVNTVIVKPNYQVLAKIIRALELLKIKYVNLKFVHPIGNAFENFKSTVPRYTLTVPFIRKAIDQSIYKDIRTTVSSVPFCFMPGYENYIQGNVFPVEALNYEKCKLCVFKDRCMGIWRNYVEKAGEGELQFLKE